MKSYKLHHNEVNKHQTTTERLQIILGISMSASSNNSVLLTINCDKLLLLLKMMVIGFGDTVNQNVNNNFSVVRN